MDAAFDDGLYAHGSLLGRLEGFLARAKRMSTSLQPNDDALATHGHEAAADLMDVARMPTEVVDGGDGCLSRRLAVASGEAVGRPLCGRL